MVQHYIIGFIFMAGSRAEALRGIDYSGKASTLDTPKPLRLTQSQVNHLMFVSPEELAPDHPVRNAVGTWYMHEDGHEVWFKPVSAERLREITVVDFAQKRRKLMGRVRDYYSRTGLLD